MIVTTRAVTVRVHPYRIRQNPTKIRKAQSLGTTEAGGVLLTHIVLILSFPLSMFIKSVGMEAIFNISYLNIRIGTYV